MGSPLRYSSEDLTAKYSLDRDTTDGAFDSFDRGRAILLAFSGKIGAGKDSVAPKTFEALHQLEAPVRTDAFGADLKSELNGLISVTASHGAAEPAAREIASSSGVTLGEARHTVELMLPEISEGTLTNAYDRTTGSRAALQYWATEVRRAQDPLYWVKPVIERTIAAAARGISTQITDVRFLTEAWGAIDSGGWTIRLDVSPGIEISEAAKSHSSETELDSFQRFAVRISTDGYSSAKAVARAVAIGVEVVADI
jgi:hypothetical protein